MHCLIDRFALATRRETINRFCEEGALMKRLTRPALAFGLLLASYSPALACSKHGRYAYVTLRESAREAKAVLYGTLANPRLAREPGGKDEGGPGTTDFHILNVIKSDPALDQRKVIEIPRYLFVPDPKNPPKFLLFVDVAGGKIDPVRGMAVESPAVIDYLKGAMTLKEKDQSRALAYFFRYLDHADGVVALDAFREFGQADDQVVRAAKKFYSPEKLARWLQDPKTPAERLGVYALLLAHCGSAKHTPLLTHLLDHPDKLGKLGDPHLVMAGYTLLKPKDGWARVRRFLQDPEKPFRARYGAIRALQFFWQSRPDVVAKKDLLEGVRLILDQGDVADFAVESLRRWGCWKLTDHVLGLYDKKSHDVPIVRRAILRYALVCPQPRAAAFVQKMRQQDQELVADIEETLQLEASARAEQGKTQPKTK
jgi:hypothetical protein